MLEIFTPSDEGAEGSESEDTARTSTQAPVLRFTSYYQGRAYSGLKDIATALIRSNRHVFNEAEPLLYQFHCFSFEGCGDDGISFLHHISCRARQSIRRIRLELWGRLRRFDNSKWNRDRLTSRSKVCTYIANNLHLRELRFDAIVLAVLANFPNEALALEFIQIKGLSSISQSPGTLACYRYAMSKDGEPDEGPNNLLQSRMNALLAYLRSEMLDRSAPPQSNDEWVWEGPGNQTLWGDEEPDW